MYTSPWLNRYGCFLPHVCSAVNHWSALAEGDVSYSIIILNLCITIITNNSDCHIYIKNTDVKINCRRNINNNATTVKHSLDNQLFSVNKNFTQRHIRWKYTYIIKLQYIKHLNRHINILFIFNLKTQERLVICSLLSSTLALLWQFYDKRCTKCSHCSSNCEWQSTRISCIADRLDGKFPGIKYLRTIVNLHTYYR